MLRPIFCLLALACIAMANEELTLEPFTGPLRHLMVRPVASYADQLTVTLGLTVVDVDVDEANNKATIGGWLNLNWTNIRLAWTDGPVEHTRVIPSQMWTPDILPYNRVPTVGEWMSPTPAIIYRSGDVIYIPPVSITVHCRRNVTSDQDRLVCPIKLGSWTYSTAQMDLQPQSSSLDTTSLIANGCWTVESSSLTREEKTYACCPETYVSLQAELLLKPQRC